MTVDELLKMEIKGSYNLRTTEELNNRAKNEFEANPNYSLIEYLDAEGQYQLQTLDEKTTRKEVEGVIEMLQLEGASHFGFMFHKETAS